MTGIDSDILVILVQAHTIEACHCILSQHGEGEVAGNEVGSDRVVTCAAVADRETWLDLAGHADLLKADHAALVLAYTQKENAGCAVLGNRELVGGDEWDAAPGDEGLSEEVHNDRRNSAAGGLAAKGGDGLGMGEEECGLFPDQTE